MNWLGMVKSEINARYVDFGAIAWKAAKQQLVEIYWLTYLLSMMGKTMICQRETIDSDVKSTVPTMRCTVGCPSWWRCKWKDVPKVASTWPWLLQNTLAMLITLTRPSMFNHGFGSWTWPVFLCQPAPSRWCNHLSSLKKRGRIVSLFVSLWLQKTHTINVQWPAKKNIRSKAIHLDSGHFSTSNAGKACGHMPTHFLESACHPPSPLVHWDHLEKITGPKRDLFDTGWSCWVYVKCFRDRRLWEKLPWCRDRCERNEKNSRRNHTATTLPSDFWDDKLRFQIMLLDSYPFWLRDALLAAYIPPKSTNSEKYLGGRRKKTKRSLEVIRLFTAARSDNGDLASTNRWFMSTKSLIWEQIIVLLL